MTTYLVICGNHTSAKTPVGYVEHIVYGEPEIRAIEVGSHFVALCTYAEGEENTAEYTKARMGSFPHAASLFTDKGLANEQVGAWVVHYAPRNEQPRAPFGSDPSGFTRV